jgi:CRISPR system Cascade subunit CasD
MPVFTMRLCGPIASLAGVQIDGSPSVLPIPTRSMIVGMLGAAQGWAYRDHVLLQKLQDELELGFVVHKAGTVVWDYQTTDLTKPHMLGPMWVLGHDCRPRVFAREGGGHERVTANRPLTCDIDITAIVGVKRDPLPLLAALERPVFPLTLGRRGMYPTEPIAGVIIDVATVAEGVELLAREHLGARRWTPVTGPASGQLRTVPAGRDWRSRRHGGVDTYSIDA